MTKLLNIDANPKTVKGRKHGFMTAVLYLAPYKTAGFNVCPTAELAGCWKTCLNTAGRGGMPVGGTFVSPGGIELPNNTIQHARIRRTQMWVREKEAFLAQLDYEIALFVHRAKKAGLTPVVRLNGTSDIVWESNYNFGVPVRTTVFERFPDIQFYDYTKLPARLSRAGLPGNYHLTVSYSEASPFYQKQCQRAYEDGASIVAVVKDQELKDRFLELGAIDMDQHDLRFLDPPNSIGVLKAKGSAKKETNGFVLQEVSPWLSSALAHKSSQRTHSRKSPTSSSPRASRSTPKAIGASRTPKTQPLTTEASSRARKTA